jgi:ribosomal protein RSM22 (predicted rRNA methylase)
MIKSKQKYTSKNTSINKTKKPRIFNDVKNKSEWRFNTINLDIGGGKYDTLTEALFEEYSIKSYVYDPFNRTEEHNKDVLTKISDTKSDTVTISNVLNVIKEKSERLNLLFNAFHNMKENGTLYITIYEGDSSGIEKIVRSDQFQLNRKTIDYIAELNEVFANVVIKGKLLICRK